MVNILEIKYKQDDSKSYAILTYNITQSLEEYQLDKKVIHLNYLENSSNLNDNRNMLKVILNTIDSIRRKN